MLDGENTTNMMTLLKRRATASEWVRDQLLELLISRQNISYITRALLTSYLRSE